MILDSKLNFKSHLENKNLLGIMIQLKQWASHLVLEVVYKLYVRPHLDYGDIIYHSENPQKDPSLNSLTKLQF